MLRGSEAYLEMWERASGIPSSRCLGPARALRPAWPRPAFAWASPTRRFWSAPGSRCEGPARGATASPASAIAVGAANAVLTPGGSVALVASTAPGTKAEGIGPGTGAARLRHTHAKPIGHGLWTLSLEGAVLVYSVRDGVVRTVAIATPGVARTDTSLRAYMRLVPRRGVAARPSRVIGAAPRALAPGKAVPLGVDHGSSQFPFTQHGSGQFPFFCGL